jgi:hypothetical protein
MRVAGVKDGVDMTAYGDWLPSSCMCTRGASISR